MRIYQQFASGAYIFQELRKSKVREPGNTILRYIEVGLHRVLSITENIIEEATYPPDITVDNFLLVQVFKTYSKSKQPCGKGNLSYVTHCRVGQQLEAVSGRIFPNILRHMSIVHPRADGI